MSKNMNEKGMVIQMSDTQDLNPESIWGMKRQKARCKNFSRRDAIGFLNYFLKLW